MAYNPDEVAVREIQFITNERIMIPGTASVGVRGQLLRIGPGELGAQFPYRSPRQQINHYGKQHYMLIGSFDAEGSPIENDPDLMIRVDGGGIVEPGQEDDSPTGVHDVIKQRSFDPYEGQTPPAPEPTKSSTNKATTKKKAAPKSGTSRRRAVRKK